MARIDFEISGVYLFKPLTLAARACVDNHLPFFARFASRAATARLACAVRSFAETPAHRAMPPLGPPFLPPIRPSR